MKRRKMRLLLNEHWRTLLPQSPVRYCNKKMLRIQQREVRHLLSPGAMESLRSSGNYGGGKMPEWINDSPQYHDYPIPELRDNPLISCLEPPTTDFREA